MAELLLWPADLAPFLAGLWQLVKALLLALAVAGGSLIAIAATVIAVFGDESGRQTPDPRKALAQRNRTDFVRRGRWVGAEQIRRHIEEMEPPFYDKHSFSN